MGDIHMNNQKMVLSEWKQYLEEVRRDDYQIGLIVYGILNAFIDKIKYVESLSKSHKEKQELFHSEIAGLKDEGSDILKRIKDKAGDNQGILDYVSNISFEEKKETNSYDPIELLGATYTHAGPNKGKLNIEFSIKPWRWPEDSVTGKERNKKLFYFVNNFKSSLYDVVAHELQHAKQQKNRETEGKFSISKTFNLKGEKGGFFEKLKRISRNIAEQIKSAFEETSDDRYREQIEATNIEYGKHLRSLVALSKKYTSLKQVRSLPRGKMLKGLVPVSILDYYMNPSEIEAYSKGWFFASKRNVENNKAIKAQLRKLPTKEDRIDLKRKEIKKKFLLSLKLRVNFLRTSGKNQVEMLWANAPRELTSQLNREELLASVESSVNDFESKILEYATNRFRSLR
jgi:hypothetical protein